MVKDQKHHGILKALPIPLLLIPWYIFTNTMLGGFREKLSLMNHVVHSNLRFTFGYVEILFCLLVSYHTWSICFDAFSTYSNYPCGFNFSVTVITSECFKTVKCSLTHTHPNLEVTRNQNPSKEEIFLLNALLLGKDDSNILNFVHKRKSCSFIRIKKVYPICIYIKDNSLFCLSYNIVHVYGILS